MATVLLRAAQGTAKKGSIIETNDRKARRLVASNAADFTTKPVSKKVARKKPKVDD